MRGWLIMLLMLLCPSVSWAAPALSESDWIALKALARGSGVGTSVETGTEVPATCTPGTGPNALFLDSDDELLYYCSATDTFIQVSPPEADTAQTVYSRGTTYTGANSFANGPKWVDSNGDGIGIYTDATDGPQLVCIDNNVANACTSYTRKLAAGQTVVYQNASGTPIFTLTESTGALTNTTLSYASNALEFQIDERKAVAACQAAAAQAVWNTPSSNAPAAVCDGSATIGATLDFDATTDESYSMQIKLPTGFQSLIWHFDWKAAATTGAVGWCVQLVRVTTTTDPALPAKSASNCVSDTAAGTTLNLNTASITSPTCTSCVAGDLVNVVVSRNASGSAVTDSMTGDAKLHTTGPVYVVRQ